MLLKTETSGKFRDALVSYLEFCSHPLDQDAEKLLVSELLMKITYDMIFVNSIIINFSHIFFNWMFIH